MNHGFSSEQFELLERFERLEPAPALVQAVQVAKTGSLYLAGAVV
jgi:hypothetical protein